MHALNYQEYRYEMSIIADALRTMINLKQKENESLQDYTKRLRLQVMCLSFTLVDQLN
jgi:hypothetical protein